MLESGASGIVRTYLFFHKIIENEMEVTLLSHMKHKDIHFYHSDSFPCWKNIREKTVIAFHSDGMLTLDFVC